MVILVLLLALGLGILWISHFKLKKRFDALARSLPGEEAGPSTVAQPKPGVPGPVKSPPKRPKAGSGPGPWDKVAKAAKVAPETAGTSHAAVETTPAKPPRNFVFRAENWRNAGRWLSQNWFLAVAALSLALAGVFLVQYGVENGLLSPFWRVMGAAFFGAALIYGGEFIRRRSGDGGSSHSAFVPSTFSGAGLVSLFAAVLAAQQLYGLIGPQAALVYLVMVSAVAVVLGWYYGPFLAVVGILGSLAAPFLVGGESTAPWLFFYYFALIIVAAFAVDAIKRWAWVSAFALILGFAAAWYIWDLGAASEHFLAFALISTFAAIAIPPLSIRPRHQGPLGILGWGWGRGAGPKEGAKTPLPEFPTRLAAGTFSASVAVAVLVALQDTGPGEIWLAIASIGLLFAAIVVWARKAPALDDLAPVAALGFVGIIVMQALDFGSIWQAFQAGAQRAPETAAPISVTILTYMAVVGSALACWRSLWGGMRHQAWAAGAALLAPLVLIILEIAWEPVAVVGQWRWAADAMVIAALMVLFATLVARRDGDDLRRVAYFTLAALTMISFALVIILTSAALTVALAVMVLLAALIDRRLGLPLLSYFVQVGAIVVGWRLVFVPGIFWGTEAPIWEVWLAYAGSVAMLSAGWVVLSVRDRQAARITVESGIWASLGVFINVLLYRAMDGDIESHWAISLFASVWLILMIVQLYRLQSGGRLMWWVRVGLAVVYGLVALLGYLVLYVLFNPLNPIGSSYDPAIGPLVADSLFVAFGLPAIILSIGVWKVAHLHRVLRVSFIAFAAVFAISYVAFEIRRLWQGPDLSMPYVSQGELYSYTIAMLLASVGLLFLAFSRRSVAMRRIAILGIAATIAKVFLIDMAGLTGLMRVASFFGLGMSLAGLGWVYRRMVTQWEPDNSDT